MRLLYAYFKRHALIVCALFLCALIFATVIALYNLPFAAVGYAVLLSAFVCLLFFIAGFLRYRARHKTLVELTGSIFLTRDGLPEPRDRIEADYQALIASVMRETEEALLRADREKADMLEYYTLWAHQIKTPIAAMRLILQGDEDERARELLTQLFRTERYADMVLAYLRIGSDSTDLVLREYPVDQIVRAAVRKYASLFIRKRISIHLSPMPDRVVTDEKWLCFVVEQLLSNAIKYTREGGEIRVYTRDGCLYIQDNGIGIAPEDLPRVFEKGFTGYNGRADMRASGIGLYLSKRVLDRLGHRIAITSRPGEGACARILLISEKRVFE